MNKREIPFASQDINDSDLKSVTDVIKSGWLAHGEYSNKLEQLFCDFTGAKYSATVSNCTAGLHLSCLSAGIGPGDEVIVPAQTHTATAHAVEFTGARPVFADIDFISGNILIEEIESKRTNKTKAIIPVHMAGNPCAMNDIQSLCDRYEIILIEDCAHSIGTNINGIHVGSFGFSGCFSFYPTKQITTGEGGVVISNNKDIIDDINKLKAFGIDTPPELRKKPGVYDVQKLGYNYRMTDFQAALGVGQMQRYKGNLKKRRKNAELYCNNLKDKENISFTSFSKENSYFIFQILIDKNLDRNKILLSLQKNGIGVSIHYATPVPHMSYYRKKYGYKIGDFPNAESYGNQCISFPVYPHLNEDDIEYICTILLRLTEQ